MVPIAQIPCKHDEAPIWIPARGDQEKQHSGLQREEPARWCNAPGPQGLRVLFASDGGQDQKTATSQMRRDGLTDAGRTARDQCGAGGALNVGGRAFCHGPPRTGILVCSGRPRFSVFDVWGRTLCLDSIETRICQERPVRLPPGAEFMAQNRVCFFPKIM
jgi:hypothetical protein